MELGGVIMYKAKTLTIDTRKKKNQHVIKNLLTFEVLLRSLFTQKSSLNRI